MTCVSEIAIEVCRHVFDIVDAAPKLSPLPKVIYAYEQSFPAAGAGGVLKAIALRCARAERDCALGRRWRGAGVALDVGVGVDGRET